VTWSEPTGKVVRDKVALPPVIHDVAKVVSLKLNVTIPVGRLPLLVSVAVNFTDAPLVDGFGAAVSNIVMAA